MEKLKMHSPNLTQDNIRKIMELFPNCVTEAEELSADGADERRLQEGKTISENLRNLRMKIDFDQLRQELSESIVEGPQERYHLNWPGKREALLTANAPIAKTLRPCREESVDFDTTQNLFIEGDNLEALKLLQETYLGKVKMIYIDPPYNTGNDFIYDDDFAENVDEFLKRSNQKDDSGNRLVANTEANGRFHSDWLSMMYPRLKLARNLLTDDGAIFISIDDGEVASLKQVCNEIFGGENFITSLIWKSRQIIDSRNRTKASTDHEYIVIYAKLKDNFMLQGKEIEAAKYSNPDNDPRGPWMSNSILGLANAMQRPNLHYPITDPDTGREFMCPSDTGWRYSKETMAEKISDKRILFPKSDNGRPREKKFRSELSSEFTGFSSVLSQNVGFTLNGSREVRDLFGAKYFDFPKPVSLLDVLVQQGTSKCEDIVMDFFAGSGTSAHAVVAANARDGGNRSFVLVQLPEPCDENSEAFKAGYKTIAEISKERIRRAGNKIKEENAITAAGLDIGFRVLKVDSSNMAEVYYRPDEFSQDMLAAMEGNIKPDRTPEDLLFQVLLDWGVDLSLPIRKEIIHPQMTQINAEGKAEKNNLRKSAQSVDKKVYEVFFVDENALVACFDTDVQEELVKELARFKPVRVVFRDNGFVSDAVKINVEQIFKQMSPGTEVKSI